MPEIEAEANIISKEAKNTELGEQLLIQAVCLVAIAIEKHTDAMCREGEFIRETLRGTR